MRDRIGGCHGGLPDGSSLRQLSRPCRYCKKAGWGVNAEDASARLRFCEPRPRGEGRELGHPTAVIPGRPGPTKCSGPVPRSRRAAGSRPCSTCRSSGPPLRASRPIPLAHRPAFPYPCWPFRRRMARWSPRWPNRPSLAPKTVAVQGGFPIVQPPVCAAGPSHSRLPGDPTYPCPPPPLPTLARPPLAGPCPLHQPPLHGRNPALSGDGCQTAVPEQAQWLRRVLESVPPEAARCRP